MMYAAPKSHITYTNEHITENESLEGAFLGIERPTSAWHWLLPLEVDLWKGTNANKFIALSSKQIYMYNISLSGQLTLFKSFPYSKFKQVTCKSGVLYHTFALTFSSGKQLRIGVSKLILQKYNCQVQVLQDFLAQKIKSSAI
ncbi:hypothetical protein ACFDTO_23890 [Microbacteriaceae bacterium 4G12]